MTKPHRFNRNPVARSPLMRKGGTHVHSKSGQRSRQRLSTSSGIEDWLDELESASTQADKKGGNSSPFSLRHRFFICNRFSFPSS